MTLNAGSFIKKGYIPLACNRYAGIGLQGELLRDFWMWNRQYAVCADGSKKVQTVRVMDIKEAALRYWRDGWVPLRPVDEELLRRMESALREHRGLKREGYVFPDTPFLKMPETIAHEEMGPEVKKFLGIDTGKEDLPASNDTAEKVRRSDEKKRGR